MRIWQSCQFTRACPDVTTQDPESLCRSASESKVVCRVQCVSLQPAPALSKQETAQMRTAYALLAAIALFPLSVFAAAPGDLRTMAHSAYEWYDEAYPVAASGLGDHRFHARLTDYRMSEVVRRRQHVSDLLAQVRELATDGWSKDDRIDRVLFESQLASMDFFGRRLNPEGSNPQLYVDECSNSIFTLLQKEYAPRRTLALAAMSRLEQMPALLEVARTNLTEPVKLYASLAIESARGGDDLYGVSLMTLADGLSRAESARLVKARDGAVKALHDFADWLETGLPKMPDWRPMGATSYNYLLKRVLLLPLDAHDVAHLGEIELARYRALEAMLKDPSLASPDPARAKHIPKDQAEFLAAYESRLQESDSVCAEGGALYGEEMLMREGLYPDNSPAQGQILRLSRYRAARIGVDVNLHTGRWSFEQAVKYFMEAGGLDREAAEGEAAGAASSPSQKISYITGKWQIMRLLGRYRDREGANFRLGAFHDELISYGTLPLSVIEWLMFDDESSVREAIK